MPWLRRAPSQRLPRSAPRSVACSGPTMTRAASSTRGNLPTVMPMSIGPLRTWLMPTSPRGSTRRCPSGVAANRAITMVTGAPIQIARACRPSVVASRKHHSHRASDRPLTLPSTPGRRTLLYGWKTFGSPVGPEERMMITLSSSTSPSVSGSTVERGSNS
jgi:hypothetical protein